MFVISRLQTGRLSSLCHSKENHSVLHHVLLSTAPPLWSSEVPSSEELDRHLTPPPRTLLRPSRWCRRSLFSWTSTRAAQPWSRWGAAERHRWLLREGWINSADHMTWAAPSKTYKGAKVVLYLQPRLKHLPPLPRHLLETNSNQQSF